MIGQERQLTTQEQQHVSRVFDFFTHIEEIAGDDEDLNNWAKRVKEILETFISDTPFIALLFVSEFDYLLHSYQDFKIQQISGVQSVYVKDNPFMIALYQLSQKHADVNEINNLTKKLETTYMNFLTGSFTTTNPEFVRTTQQKAIGRVGKLKNPFITASTVESEAEKYEIVYENGSCFIDDEEINLPPSAKSLVRFLIESADHQASYETLIDHYFADIDTSNQRHLNSKKRLLTQWRHNVNKVAAKHQKPEIILTNTGEGYYLNPCYFSDSIE